MQFYKYILTLSCLWLLSGCIEIIDDLTLNDDNSGTLKYSINLSSSKIKINSILALDSINGQKVPELDSIRHQIEFGIAQLKAKKGIKSVEFIADYDEFIFKVIIHFEHLDLLQEAFREMAKDDFKADLNQHNSINWLSFSDKKLTRSIPLFIVDQKINLDNKEKERLKEGKYISITRFNSSIISCSNPASKIAKNQTACMIQENALSIVQNPKLIDNIIKVK